MRNAAGIVISGRSEDRNDSHASIVSNLVSLITRIRQTEALIESAIMRDAAVADQEIAATIAVLDDVTPGYMMARAALNSCEADLWLALQCWMPGRRTV
jgi:hypothetical protein